MPSVARIREFADRRYRLLLVGVLVLGALCRVGVGLDLAANDPEYDVPSLDSKVYLEWASGIAAGDLGGTRPFFLNPLYPYFLAPILAVAPESPMPPIRIVQGLLGLAMVLFVAAATRRLLGKPEALVAALLAATYPVLLFYEQLAMIVPLAVFLNALALLLLARFADRGTLPAAALAGIPIGFAILARPNVALFLLLLPLWLGTATLVRPAGLSRLRFVLTRSAVLFVTATVVVLPVTIRNWIVGRDLVIVTSSMGVNLWQSNNPEAWRTGRMTSREIRFNTQLVESDAHRIAEEDEGRPLRPSEVSSYWVRRTLAVLKSEPAAAAGFLLRKAGLFLGSYEAPSSHHYEAQREHSPFLGSLPVTFAVLCPLALVGLALVLLRRRRALPFAFLFLAYFVGLTIFFPLSHYRAPVLPAVFPLAAVGIGMLVAPLGDRRIRAVAGRAALLLVAVVLCQSVPIAVAVGATRDLGDPAEMATFWYNRGLTLLQKGDREEAAAAFANAREVNPGSWLPELGEAVLAREEGDLAAEGTLLEQALRKSRGDPGIMAGLGVNLYDRGLRPQGLSLCERAVRSDPRDVILRGRLAQLYLREGRPPDALRELRAEEELGRPEPTGRVGQIWCLRHMGRTREAFEVLEDSLRRFPKFAPFFFERAYLLANEGAPREEIARAVREGRDAGGRVPPDLAPFLDR